MSCPLQGLSEDLLLLILTHCDVRSWLRLGATCRQFERLMEDDELWSRFATRKWGHKVQELSHVQPGGWRQWCTHRVAHVHLPASPLQLAQEAYPDPWPHLACTLLCSRTSGGLVIRQAIAEVLRRWPTPSALLEARERDLLAAMRPLGLQAVRAAALRSMSHDFLARDWEDPSEFKGCGRFAADSWRIFCRGHAAVKDIEDATLQRYLRWLASGQAEDKPRRGAPPPRARKRAAERPAEPGTLRSGRRRGGGAAPAGSGVRTRGHEARQ